MSETVEVVGDGSADDPYRPDYDGPYQKAEYHDDGTVTIDPLDGQ